LIEDRREYRRAFESNPTKTITLIPVGIPFPLLHNPPNTSAKPGQTLDSTKRDSVLDLRPPNGIRRIPTQMIWSPKTLFPGGKEGEERFY
jgi:hypothetical protein